MGRMAPEIIENWKVLASDAAGTVYRPSADVYSATVCVWECLTCQQPYVDTAGDALKDQWGKKLVGLTLTDGVVDGLRPSMGRIPNGEGGYVLSAYRHWWSVVGLRIQRRGRWLP